MYKHIKNLIIKIWNIHVNYIRKNLKIKNIHVNNIRKKYKISKLKLTVWIISKRKIIKI